MPDETELLPCPFCGVDTNASRHDEDCYFEITAKDYYSMSDKDSEIYYSAAIKAWNTRAGDKK